MKQIRLNIDKNNCGDWISKKCYWLEWYTPDGADPFHKCYLKHFSDNFFPNHSEKSCEDFIEENSDSLNRNLNKLKKYKIKRGV